jgi:hypothetical protein
MIRESLKKGFNLTLQNWPLILIQILLNGALTLAIEIPTQLGKAYFLNEWERIFNQASINLLKALQELLVFLKEHVDVFLTLGFYLFSMLLIWSILLFFIQGGIRGILKDALFAGMGINPWDHLSPLSTKSESSTYLEGFIQENRQEVFPFLKELEHSESSLSGYSSDGLEKIRLSGQPAFKMRRFIRYGVYFFPRMLTLQAWSGLILILLFGILLASSSLAFYLLNQSTEFEQGVGMMILGSASFLFFLLFIGIILAQPYASISIVLKDLRSFRGLRQGIRFVMDHLEGVLGLFFIFLGLLGVLTLMLELGDVTVTHVGSILSEKNPLFKVIFLILTYLIWNFFQSFLQLFALGSQMSYYALSQGVYTNPSHLVSSDQTDL